MKNTVISPKVRCAVYTRKSTDEGLDMEFNSLEAQRESCLSFISSQKSQGWIPVADRYDDPAFSGGTMNRPALQRLIQDIEAGRINAVVVYKIDRLSRSLADFTRLTELFDRHQVALTSVTQSFNTATSMGRLTLNMLLSFAQFERENSADRIRDKFAASKRKGMWMGGRPVLGYDIQNRELVVNPQEAEQVRFIFRRFSECGSPTRVVMDLRTAGTTNKSWITQNGSQCGGKPIDKATLYRLLNNRVYLGEMTHKGEPHPGRHQAIIDLPLWDKVHGLIDQQRRDRSALPRGQTPFPLKSLVRCGHCGVAMRPSHTRKKAQIQYRYYVCTHADKNSYADCTLPNIPAAELERLVLNRLRNLLKAPELMARAIRQVRVVEPDIEERDIITLLTQLDPIWEELFPLEQNRLLKLLVASITVTPQGVDIRLLIEGLSILVTELNNERIAA